MCIPGTALSRYINFYTDFAFKKIFGTEANKDLLISFLNGLFNLEGDAAIVDVTYLGTEQLGDNMQERRAIYDVYCKTNKGERFIVEMQKAQQDNLRDRTLYYSTFALREQAVKGNWERPWDYKLSPVYVVGILNFVMDKSDDDEYLTRVKLKDQKNRDFSDNLNFVFLEMPKFTKKECELSTFLDKWLYVIKNLYKLREQPQALTEGIFRKLFEVAEIASYNSDERSNYEESLKNLWDLNNCLDAAKRNGHDEGFAEGRAEGEAIGLEKGEAIGLEKGEAIGLEKGKEAGKLEERTENARRMKECGIDSAIISTVTGLTLSEIEAL